MLKIVIPNANQFPTTASFFSELILINKKKNAKFSHRFFAKKLDWPVSYIADLIKGRKQLTLSRALEFTKRLQLDLLETEKVIYLALANTGSDDVKKHFAKRLKDLEVPSKKSLKRTTLENPELFSQIEIGAVFEILKWARKPLKAKFIQKLLFTFPDLSEENIEDIIVLLEKNKLIEISGEKLTVLQHELILDQFDDLDSGVHIHKYYAENFVRYTQNPRFPGTFHSGFIEIPKGQFNEVAHKLIAMRNWLLQYSLQNNLKDKNSLEESFIYQFDINLVLMMEKSVIEKISSEI